ncbi:MAG: BREX system ATP-binding domain-containing protein [Persicimonas sp.]
MKTRKPSIEDASAATCAHVIQRLGESGQPPERGVELINVGNDSYLEVLEEQYFDGLLDGGASFKLVQGYFGGGKTHFLYCVRDMAWRHGFAVALVELSPVECPYDDTLKVYSTVARRITAAHDEAGQSRYGIGELLRQAVDRRREQLAEEFAAQGSDYPQSAAEREVERWLRGEVARTVCESASYRKAVVEFALGWLEEDYERVEHLEAWLIGEPIPRSKVRDYGVYEEMSRANGFLMLRSLTQMLRGLGFAGSALLFDEVDRNLSVTAKRSQQIGDNLRQVIDLCGRHQLPNTLFMYAVPPEFMRTVVPDYPALHQRLKSPVPLSVRSPQAVLIDLEKLDLPADQLLAALGERIVPVFEVARGVELDAELQADNAAVLGAACVNTQFEVNHRRLFVKTFVDLLQWQAVDGEVELDLDAAIDLVIDGHQALSEAGSGNVVKFEDY